jgi:lipopolysaccharide export system protein LptC
MSVRVQRIVLVVLALAAAFAGAWAGGSVRAEQTLVRVRAR